MNIIVLTGGTSKRFGSDKSQAKIHGKTLLEYLSESLENLIIVGPETSIPAKYVREEPIGAGPVAAIAAAMLEVDSDLVAIYATDMPFAPRITNQLINALKNDAAIAIDCDGKMQPLAGVYRSDKLKGALSTYQSVENQSVKSLIAKLVIDQVPVIETELLMDIDTQEDLLKAVDLASRLAP
jgi:molybdopterin-guanine dinucleotide biosynthesis protein A